MFEILNYYLGNLRNVKAIVQYLNKYVIKLTQADFKEGNFAYGDHTDFPLLHQFGQKDSFRMSSR